MFKAINIIQKKKDHQEILVKKDDEILGSTQAKIEKITKYFKSTFRKNNFAPIDHNNPQKLEIPFSTEEIEKAQKQLKCRL